MEAENFKIKQESAKSKLERLETVWRLGSGEIVVDKENNSHVATHPDVLPLLDEALAKIQSSGRREIIEEIDFGRPIGETICVETHEGDEIVYAQRANRSGLTRFVKNRRSEPCNSVTVNLFKAEESDCYILNTAFIGHPAPAEPWDAKGKLEESAAFWNTHALVWNKESILSGTETDKCPW